MSLLIFYLTEEKKPELTWTMVNVNHTKAQGDAHLIQVEEGLTILIDAGYAGPAKDQLLPFLEKNKISRLDLVFITHAHRDHYEGIEILLKAGIHIQHIYFNIPDKTICDHEIPWGCNYTDILRVHQIFKEKRTAIKVAEAGQQYDLGNGALLKLLYAFDGINTPVGQTDINDMSLVLMLEYSGYKFLFGGDLNTLLGEYLADHAEDIRADVLKVPHHGTAGLPPNEFFQKVSPKYALVPSPRDLWCSKRSSEPRNWFRDNNIPVYVNGFSGHVKVQIQDNQLQVIPEKETTVSCEGATPAP